MPENLEKLTVGKGMTDWQGLYMYADAKEIILSQDNPTYTIHDGSIYTRDMSTLLLYRGTGETFRIPDGVKAIDSAAFRGNEGGLALKTLSIRASLQTIPAGAFTALTGLESFEVDSGSVSFAAWDGLLYSKDGKQLLACPLGRTGTVTIREGTVEICEKAFYYGGNLKAETVIVPEGVTIIRAGNFSSSPYSGLFVLHLPASATDIHPDIFEYANDVEVHCPTGSLADTLAREAGVTVINN